MREEYIVSFSKGTVDAAAREGSITFGAVGIQ